MPRGIHERPVLGGLAVLLLGYVALAATVGRRSPTQFLRQLRDVQLLAFSTSSSATAMPLSIETAEAELDARRGGSGEDVIVLEPS